MQPSPLSVRGDLGINGPLLCRYNVTGVWLEAEGLLVVLLASSQYAI